MVTTRSTVVAVWIAALVISANVAALAQQETGNPLRVRISEGVLRALVVHRVLPEYPADALKRGVDGKVTVKVFIDTQGDVKQTSAVEGDPLLATAATEAVKQWKFKPYYLNRKPVPIESQVTITFELKGNKGTVRY